MGLVCTLFALVESMANDRNRCSIFPGLHALTSTSPSSLHKSTDSDPQSTYKAAKAELKSAHGSWSSIKSIYADSHLTTTQDTTSGDAEKSLRPSMSDSHLKDKKENSKHNSSCYLIARSSWQWGRAFPRCQAKILMEWNAETTTMAKRVTVSEKHP